MIARSSRSVTVPQGRGFEGFCVDLVAEIHHGPIIALLCVVFTGKNIQFGLFEFVARHQRRLDALCAEAYNLRVLITYRSLWGEWFLEVQVMRA